MKVDMKGHLKGHTLTAATAALAIATALSIGAAPAADPSSTANPGFAPDTGRINSGQAAQPWTTAPPLPQDKQPAQEDARAALMMPDNGAPSAGQTSGGQASGGQASGGQASGGQASGGQASGGQTSGGQTSAGQTSVDQATPPAQNSAAPPAGGDATSTAANPAAGPQGPIGATIQTMPAKFSRRNDLLDHMPMMAWPLPLNEQQRQQIYQAVMADKSQPVEGAAALKPAGSLSFEQKREMQPLPDAVMNIDGLQGLKFVKGKDKVFLVRPSSGIVVDEITM
jgi:hypothetical protein